MEAIAKNNLFYPEYDYILWKKGKIYNCWEENDLLRIVDERGVIFNFSRIARNDLNSVFDFNEGGNE